MIAYSMLILQGGLGGAQAFAKCEKLVNLLKKQKESNRPYGAICASPALVLEPHGLLKVGSLLHCSPFVFCFSKYETKMTTELMHFVNTFFYIGLVVQIEIWTKEPVHMKEKHSSIWTWKYYCVKN